MLHVSKAKIDQNVLSTKPRINTEKYLKFYFEKGLFIQILSEGRVDGRI